MTYKLFIDDERFPVTDDWIIARSSKEAIHILYHQGMPSEIAFDHDLGGDDTSMKFCHALFEYMAATPAYVPAGFKYSIHSQNPIGAQNISGYMDQLLTLFND